MTNKNYSDKLFSILGDSISTLLGYSVPSYAAFYDTERKLLAGILTPADTWWGRVIEALGGTLLVNDSFLGTTVAWRSLYEIPAYACSDERTSALGRCGLSPDVIMVHMGTNDWGAGLRIRSDEMREGDREPTAIFSLAYDAMLGKLRRNYPEAEIWCLTLPISKCTSRENFTFPFTFRGRHIDEYCDAIRDCARGHGCRLIDLNRFSAPYDTIDGVHPNADGMKTIADAVLDAIRQ